MIVLGEGGIMQAKGMHSLIGHILLGQHFGDFTTTVGSKIKAYNSISVLDKSYRLLIISCNDGWLYKLICDLSLVGLLDCRNRCAGRKSFTIYQGIVGQFYTFPTFIPVHSKIASANRGNFTNRFVQMRLKFGYKTQPTFWVGIPSVCKGLDEDFF